MAKARALGSSSSPLFLISLLLFSIANASFIPYNALSVTGQLCCTSNGNCPGSPLVGALVTLTCSNSFFTTAVGQNTTTADGSFTITAPAPSGLGSSFGLTPSCIVTTQLPLSPAICPVLSSTTGSLISLLQSTGTTVNQVLGTVLNLRVLLVFRAGFF